MDIKKLPPSTVPWSKLRPGDCFLVPGKEEVFMKVQNFKDIRQYNIDLTNGECYGEIKNKEMPVIPITAELKIKVKSC